MKTTRVFSWNLEAYHNNKSIIANKGSTRSSKTWSILQLLYIIAKHSKEKLTISVVSESMPHLKRGCIRDFETMLRSENEWNDKNWNKTDKIYKVGSSVIEFFSVDQPGKVHGPARDILFMNEAINISFETYRQLAIRTGKTIFIDLNPNYEFWLDEHILPRDEAVLINSTYKDNDHLTPEQIREIESNKHDEEWWKVYGLGLTGSRVGLVMQNWDIVDLMPKDYKARWVGLDFGYSNDPTAIIDIRLSGGELYIDEILYEKGFDNTMIAKWLKDNNITRSIPIIADSAEPKSIAEIKSFGFYIEPAIKGADSINQGISILNRYKKHITQRSSNVVKEYRNYRWKTDEFGKPTNKPIDLYNHANDAIRYVALRYLQHARPATKTRIAITETT